MFLIPLVSKISGVIVSSMCPLARPSPNTAAARYALNDLDVTGECRGVTLLKRKVEARLDAEHERALALALMR
jgi:hypothetical protein